VTIQFIVNLETAKMLRLEVPLRPSGFARIE
jgi:hypothetical protein